MRRRRDSGEKNSGLSPGFSVECQVDVPRNRWKFALEMQKRWGETQGEAITGLGGRETCLFTKGSNGSAWQIL